MSAGILLEDVEADMVEVAAVVSAALLSPDEFEYDEEAVEPMLDVEARLAAIWTAASCLAGFNGEVLRPRDERGRELEELALEGPELIRP